MAEYLLNIDFGYMALYLLSHILLATALGMLAMRLRFKLSPVSLFLMGAATTPFVIGCLTLLLLCLPFQIPRWIYRIAPAILAVPILLICPRGRNKGIRIIEQAKQITALFAVAILLFPLLCINTAVLERLLAWFSLPILALICLLWGGLLAVFTLLLRKDKWRDMCLRSKVIVFTGQIISDSVTLAFVLCGYYVMSTFGFWAGFAAMLTGICLTGAMAYAQYIVLRRTGILESAEASHGSFLWGTGACAVLLQCTGVYLMGCIQAPFVRLAFLGCWTILVICCIFLAVFLFGRMRKTEAYRNEPREGFAVVARRLCRPLVTLLSLMAVFSLLFEAALLSIAPTVGSDAKEYLTSAYEIADQCTFESINSFNGSEDGSQIGVVHHPTWIAYLAQALTFAPDNALGYPHDYAARMAFQLCYVYMLIAVYAVARSFLPPVYSLLAAAITVCSPGLPDMLRGCSRDGFRVIPLLCFLLAVFGYSCLPRQKKAYVPELICIFLLSAFTMMGHVINAISIVAIACAFLLLCVLRREFRLNYIWMGIIAALGAASGCIQILIGYLKRGQLLSEFVSVDYVLAGTPYFENFKAYQSSRLQGTQSYFERIGSLLCRDYGVISVVGTVFCIAIIVLAVSRIKAKREQGILTYLALIGVCSAFLLTDLIQWSEYTYSEWALMNVRYLMHMYPIFALVITGGLYWLSKADGWKKPWRSVIVTAMLIGYAAFSFVNGTRYPSAQLVSYTEDANGVASAYTDHVSSKGRMLIDNFTQNYYLHCEAMTIFSEAASDIRRAQTQEALAAALRESDIDAVMITNYYVPIYWKNTVLMDYLTSDSCCEIRYQKFIVYYIK